TDAEHAEVVQFVREFGFDMMGVFAFSAEPGTPMGKMPGQIPPAVKQARLDELMSVQQEIAFEKARQRVGESLEVLIDAPAETKGRWTGRTSWQAPEIDSVTLVKAADAHPG